MEDSDAIARLALTLGYEVAGGFGEARLGAVLNHRDHVVLVAEDEGGAPVGWLHAFAAVRLTSWPFVEIGGLVVEESRRRAGIGAALLEVVHGWALRNGYERIRVRVNEKRSGAHAFYVRAGYDLAKQQHVYEHEIGV